MEAVIEAPPERVFDVLRDGWTYSDWVVGTVHVRDVDPEWPRPGSRLYHKAGPWPFSLWDRSTVLSCSEPHQLSLRAGLWPIGEATVSFTLSPVGAYATQVTMAETASAGPLRWAWNQLNDLVLHRRNEESLRRLADIATRRRPSSRRLDPPCSAARGRR